MSALQHALTLARLAVESYVEAGEIIRPPFTLPEELRRQAPVFVTLRKGNALRGCIGTLEPRWPSIAHEIILNAIAAATEDSRFPPVEQEELASLLYEIDVLTPLEAVADASALDPQRYGVAVEALGRRGVLLPAIEGVSSAEEQVAIAKRKAGLTPECAVRLYRFEVLRYREGEEQQS